MTDLYVLKPAHVFAETVKEKEKEEAEEQDMKTRKNSLNLSP